MGTNIEALGSQTGYASQARFDFKAMVEEMPGLVWTARPDGSLDFVSQRCCAFFNRTFEQMVEWGWAAIVHPEDLPVVGEHWSKALEMGEPYGLYFRLLRASDGAYRRHLVRALPCRDASGKITQWFGVSIDVEGY